MLNVRETPPDYQHIIVGLKMKNHLRLESWLCSQNIAVIHKETETFLSGTHCSTFQRSLELRLTNVTESQHHCTVKSTQKLMKLA